MASRQLEIRACSLKVRAFTYASPFLPLFSPPVHLPFYKFGDQHIVEVAEMDEIIKKKVLSMVYLLSLFFKTQY